MLVSSSSRDSFFSLGFVSVCALLNGIVVNGQFGGGSDGVMGMIPDNVKEVIPDVCQSGPDAELQKSIDCAFGNILQCAGLYGVIDEFENLIPSSASNCNDVQGPFCVIASNCKPCADEFEALLGCVATYSEPGAIDASILDLVNGCPLNCDGSSGSRQPNPNPPQPQPQPQPQPNPIPIASEDDGELKDIPTTAIENGSFTTLVTALDAADLVTTLSGQGPFTVFAPTDDAFAVLPKDLVPCLLLPENKDALSSILTYHVASGSVASTDLQNNQTIPTVQGEGVKIGVTRDAVTVNEATVIIPDVEATNGIIHVIDSVLVPPSIDLRAFLATCPDTTPIGVGDMINGDGLEDLVGGGGDEDSNDGNLVGPGDLITGGGGGLGDLIGGGGGYGDVVENVDPDDLDDLGDALSEAASDIFGDEVGDAVGYAFDSIVETLFGGGIDGGIGGEWFSF